MFCVVLFHCAHNVVFFLDKRKINFKHLIASWVNVGANWPWGETGSYCLPWSQSFLLIFLRMRELWESCTGRKNLWHQGSNGANKQDKLSALYLTLTSLRVSYDPQSIPTCIIYFHIIIFVVIHNAATASKDACNSSIRYSKATTGEWLPSLPILKVNSSQLFISLKTHLLKWGHLTL